MSEKIGSANYVGGFEPQTIDERSEVFRMEGG